MALTPAVCPNCKGILEVNSEQDAAVCRYCGTPFIIEKAINLYNVSNITIMNGKNQDDIIDDGLAQMDLNKYSDARETFQSFTKDYPRDWRGWFGLAVADYAINNAGGFTLTDACWSMCPVELQCIKDRVGKLAKLNSELIAEKSKDYNDTRNIDIYMRGRYGWNKNVNDNYSYAFSSLESDLRNLEENLNKNLEEQKLDRSTMLVGSIILVPLTIWGFLLFGNGHPIIGGLMIFTFGIFCWLGMMAMTLFSKNGLIKKGSYEGKYREDIEKARKVIDDEKYSKKEFEQRKSKKISEIKAEINKAITFQLIKDMPELDSTKYYNIDRAGRTISYTSVHSYLFSCFSGIVKNKEKSEKTSDSMKNDGNKNSYDGIDLYRSLTTEDLFAVLGIGGRSKFGYLDEHEHDYESVGEPVEHTATDDMEEEYLDKICPECHETLSYPKHLYKNMSSLECPFCGKKIKI